MIRRIVKFICLVSATSCLYSMERPPQENPIPILELPAEVQNKIFSLVMSAKSRQEAAKNIRAWMHTNRAMRAFANSPEATDYIIQQLAQRFTPHDPLVAAFALATNSAVDWIIRHHTDIEYILFSAIKGYDTPIALALIDRFPEIAKEEYQQEGGGVSDLLVEAILASNISVVRNSFSLVLI